MIVTCTMNPAIDLFCEFKNFDPFVVNRSYYEEYQANGKAINISLMLKKMGIDSIATGFLGGFSGEYIETTLKEKGIEIAFIHNKGITRINTFIHADKLEYKAVNRGPKISPEAQQELLKFIGKLDVKDSLFVSGSLPRNVDESMLIKIAQLSQKKGFSLILDISSKTLLACLPYAPELIKPSDEELAEFLGVNSDYLSNENNVFEGAQKLLNMGAQHVIISRGSKGAVYLDNKHTIISSAPKGEVINTACAGDTMLATFVGSRIKGKGVSQSLAFAIAAASSTAFTSGLSNLDDVPELMKQIHLKSIK
ncbi:1-phosphofructokinase [Sporolactobacillus sp. KGMB 08714]|uniref:1-phosphofructokinase n=1 Tax=Sporolactobacillus sp. KGMB 08714 TaxID=3064704 RepID=UPI002FBD4566